MIVICRYAKSSIRQTLRGVALFRHDLNSPCSHRSRRAIFFLFHTFRTMTVWTRRTTWTPSTTGGPRCCPAAGCSRGATPWAATGSRSGRRCYKDREAPHITSIEERVPEKQLRYTLYGLCGTQWTLLLSLNFIQGGPYARWLGYVDVTSVSA